GRFHSTPHDYPNAPALPTNLPGILRVVARERLGLQTAADHQKNKGLVSLSASAWSCLRSRRLQVQLLSGILDQTLAEQRLPLTPLPRCDTPLRAFVGGYYPDRPLERVSHCCGLFLWCRPLACS